MSNTNIVKTKPGNSIGGTHDTFTITEKVKEVNLINTHATQQLYAKIYTGNNAAAALAAAVAGTATTSTGDNVFHAPPVSARRVKILNSSRVTFACLDVLGSGSATTFDVESVGQ